MADSRPPAVATDDAQLVLDEKLAQSTRAKGSWAKSKTSAAAPGTPVTMNGPSPTTSAAFPQTPAPPAVSAWGSAWGSARTGAGEISSKTFNPHAKRKRRVFPEYDAELPLFRVLFSWNGTVLPLIVKRVEFWILWLTHGLLILLNKVGVFDTDDDDDDGEHSFDEKGSFVSSAVVGGDQRANVPDGLLSRKRPPVERLPYCRIAQVTVPASLTGLLRRPVLLALLRNVQALRRHQWRHRCVDGARQAAPARRRPQRAVELPPPHARRGTHPVLHSSG